MAAAKDARTIALNTAEHGGDTPDQGGSFGVEPPGSGKRSIQTLEDTDDKWVTCNMNRRMASVMCVAVLVICIEVAVNFGLFDIKNQEKLNVIVVGAGVPDRGMGWYHATQLIRRDVPNMKLSYVVEPYLLGAGANSPHGVRFSEWAKKTKKENNVSFFRSVDDLPVLPETTLAIIADRTEKNPQLAREAIQAGASHVYLEKPGSNEVKELEALKAFAAPRGVPIYMGYNKNVATYLQRAVAYERTLKKASLTLGSAKTFKYADLPECFEREQEGMLKSMVIHELAILATYYNVSVENIESVTPDTDLTRCLSFRGPQSGHKFTDFQRVGFTLKTKDGRSTTVNADRCGHSTYGRSFAIVSVGGQELFKKSCPSKKHYAWMQDQIEHDPSILKYFLLHHNQYNILKERCAEHILSGRAGAPYGVATIDNAITALKLAEYLTPLLKKAVGC